MTTFLEFLEAAADFAPTLNLKAAIVATGFIVMLMLTRRRGAEAKTPGPPVVRVGATGGSTSSFGRTQRNKSPLASQFRGLEVRVPSALGDGPPA